MCRLRMLYDRQLVRGKAIYRWWEFDEETQLWWLSATVAGESKHAECVSEAPKQAVCTHCQLK